MSSEPPPFQEAARCDVCKCSFNAFRRRHHCRCCGRTLCHEHSSNQMVLPQFGIHSSVRVCSDCFNNSPSREDDSEVTFNGTGTTDAFSRLDVHEVIEATNWLNSGQQKSAIDVPECKCGMPLCICETLVPDPNPNPNPAPLQNVSTFPTQPNIRRKKMDNIPKNTNSSSNSKPSLFYNLGHLTKGNLDEPKTKYEVNGEGLREAIKNSDTTAVKKLLSEGVDANYCDKQGLSLLHLAALFNQTDIAFVLMDNGANLDCKNQQGETPLDCAPTTLQYKMRKKFEEGA